MKRHKTLSRPRPVPGIVGITLAALLLAACATTPPPQEIRGAVHTAPAASASSAARPGVAARHTGLNIASAMLGTPYRYGGAAPDGFDCSGLVYYAYRRAGIAVPRTTADLYREARRVDQKHLQPGDLVFFRLTSRPVSHVGIYAGDGRFLHAPSRGKTVSYASLDNPFWRQRMVAGGRF